ncbi:hypothetical protein E1218_13085 [Kribbella turkmenica]|uniref:Uncharacterized protein n=1 Tax=Kribbella turkmenica TaxID=2530375 RepID=A0A4R4X7V4_9ACTN|nr:hypothetical protein [Kribbella turkmenica]TDD26543.1 hypothetical protein E1218_13085 [Kribbella turkmenica]
MASDESMVAVQVERLLDRTEEEWLTEQLLTAKAAWLQARELLLQPAATPAEQEQLNEQLAELADRVTRLREMGQR